MKHLPSFQEVIVEDQPKTPYPFTIAEMHGFVEVPPPLPVIVSQSGLDILLDIDAIITLNPPMFETLLPVNSPSPMPPLISTATSPLSISEDFLGSPLPPSPLSPSISTVSTGSLASAEDLLCESELNAHNESEPLEQESDSVVNSVFNSVFNEAVPDYEPILVHKQIRSSLVDYTVSEANLISQERMASFFTEYNNQVVSLNRATQLEYSRLHKEHNTLLEGIMSSLYSKWTGTSLVKDKNKNSKRLLEIQNANFKSHCLKSKKQKY